MALATELPIYQPAYELLITIIKLMGNFPRNRRQPLKWNRQAARDGIRRKVFCANQAPEEWRQDLWTLIAETPHLDWLLLTKRPQNIAKMLPADWGDGWPNVWLGTTVENQEEADRRIPHLLSAPAVVRFLSCEPLLGPLDISEWLFGRGMPCAECPRDVDCECGWMGRHTMEGEAALHWVIAGGKSGPGARPMHPDWARSLRDQCAAAGMPFFFKQWGEWLPTGDWYENHPISLPILTWNGQAWTDDGRLADREWVARIGKKRAGRLLDGVEHNAMPEVRS